jgi:hypothetical protein
VGMSEPRLTPTEHAYHLDEAYAVVLGEFDSDTDPVTLEQVARELDSDPEFLEAAWEVWSEQLAERRYTPQQVDQARSWLDRYVIGKLAKS